MAWLFGYGSLMWDADFPVEATVPATLEGYHRSFNKKSTRTWGSRDAPAPVLGLEPEGATRGTALRVPTEDAAGIARRIDEREGASYSRAKVPVELADGRTVPAFVWINARNHTYIGDVPLEDRAEMVVAAAGTGGDAVDYVLETRDRLRGFGIRDRHVESFARTVLERFATGPSRPPASG